MLSQRKKNKIAAIIPAAGSGRRFGARENKPLHSLMGKPLLIWPMEIFQGLDEISEIVPVVKQEDLETTYDLIEHYKITKVKKIVPGGAERQDSVYNALKALDSDTHLVLIHDGVRPLLDSELSKKIIYEFINSNQSAQGSKFHGIVAAVPTKDTVKEVKMERSGDHSANIFVKKTLNRETVWAIQTPQIFFFDRLIDAHEKSKKDSFYATDDSAILEKYGCTIKVIMGSYRNIKITTPEDIKIAEALLKICG